MTALVFVDTNVLIYAIDSTDPRKQAVAAAWRTELWSRRVGRISFQVLQEFYAKTSQRWPDFSARARAEVRDLLQWQPVPIDKTIIEAAWVAQDRFRLSFWDCLIVSAARVAQCRYLLTEDLQANQDLDGVLVINPFNRDFASLT